jgi:His/Glu/Gln/Arg/opine family amino acid ABC transporter permease subunit
MHVVLGWLAILAGGLVVTLELTLFTAILTIGWSTLLAIGNISPWRPLRLLASLYCDLFRSIPLLALIIFMYYGLGRLTAQLGIADLWLMVAAMTLSESAYLAEIYRGGLLAIPQGQWEAAESLGLGWSTTLRLVVLPQALPPAVPSTLNMVIAVIKDSSLASLIAVGEVTLVATTLVSETFQPMQIYLVLAVVYLALIVPIALFSHRLEIRLGTGLGVVEDLQHAIEPTVAALPEG